MVLLGLRVGVPVEVIQREAPVMLSMVHSSPWCNSMVELNPRWNSIYGGLLLCGLWANRARVFLGVLFLGAWWALGAVVPLLSPAQVLCPRVEEDGDTSRAPKTLWLEC